MFEPLSPARYKVQFTAGPDLRDDLEALKELLRTQVPDGDLAAIVGKAIREMRQRLEARRFALTKSPRKKAAGRTTRRGMSRTTFAGSYIDATKGNAASWTRKEEDAPSAWRRRARTARGGAA